MGVLAGKRILIPYGAHPDRIDPLELQSNILTAHDVANAMTKAGAIPVLHPVREEADITAFPAYDFAFNLCEGEAGVPWGFVEGTTRLWETGKPFTGNDVEVLDRAHNKLIMGRLCREHGVPTPQNYLWDAVLPKKKLIAKPIELHGSLLIHADNIIPAGGEVQRFLSPAWFFQDYLDGNEYSAVVIHGRVTAIAWLQFSKTPISTYERKWNAQSEDADHPPSLFFSAEEKPEMAEIALRAWKAVGASSYGRVDIRCDAKENPYVIDINPNGYLGTDGFIAQMWKQQGFDYHQMLAEIVRLDIGRFS